MPAPQSGAGTNPAQPPTAPGQAGAAQFDVTAALRDNLKPKLAQDSNDLPAGEPFKPGQGGPPIQR